MLPNEIRPLRWRDIAAQRNARELPFLYCFVAPRSNDSPRPDEAYSFEPAGFALTLPARALRANEIHAEPAPFQDRRKSSRFDDSRE
jgi:hypothetical protein